MFEDNSKILEKIAGQYPEDSKEYAAVRTAAIALWYALADDHERFKQYVERYDGDMTSEQREYLKKMGVDPDQDTDAQ